MPFLLLLGLMWAGGAGADDCIEAYDSAVDYFPEKAEVRHAEGFSVAYFGHFKVVTVSPPWPGGEVRYVLLRCGAPDPAGYAGVRRIQIPVKRVVAMSTTQLPHLEALDLVDRLVAVADIKPVNSPAVNRRFAAGAVAQVGHGAAVDTESLLELEPGLVMDVAYAGDKGRPQLEEAGVPVAFNLEYTEPTLLGRSEWLKFTAAFFDAEGAASTRFDSIEARYTRLAALTRDVPADRRPTLFGGALWRGTWYVAGGASYPAQLARDAGGIYLWAENPSRQSLPLDFESVYERAHGADFWVTMRNEWLALADVKAEDPRYGGFDAFSAGRVYNANARLNPHGGNDYWESGILEPEILLADLIHILHPGLLPGHRLKYYRRLE